MGHRAGSARAAYLLGRLAGSARVAPLAQIDDHQWTVLDYLHGRFDNRSSRCSAMTSCGRTHCLPARSATGCVTGCVMCSTRCPLGSRSWPTLPIVVGHGDACPNNLLGAQRPDAFVLIDFGFWKPLPLGFDLGQLLLGDVQIGRRSGDDLAAVDARIVPAYVDGIDRRGSRSRTGTGGAAPCPADGRVHRTVEHAVRTPRRPAEPGARAAGSNTGRHHHLLPRPGRGQPGDDAVAANAKVAAQARALAGRAHWVSVVSCRIVSLVTDGRVNMQV